MNYKMGLLGLAALGMAGCAGHLEAVQKSRADELTAKTAIEKEDYSIIVRKEVSKKTENFPIPVMTEWIEWSKSVKKGIGDNGKTHVIYGQFSEAMIYISGTKAVKMTDDDCDGKVDRIDLRFFMLEGNSKREKDRAMYENLDRFMAEKKRELEKDLGKSLDSVVLEWLKERAEQE